MADKWITIVHPKTDAEARVTERALEKAFADKGWKKKDEPASEPSTAVQAQSSGQQNRR